MGAALLSVAKKSFRHAEAFFRASKSSEKWGSSSCRTPFRVSRTHPSAPLTKGSRSFDRLKPRRRDLRGLSYFTDRRRASASSGTA